MKPKNQNRNRSQQSRRPTQPRRAAQGLETWRLATVATVALIAGVVIGWLLRGIVTPSAALREPHRAAPVVDNRAQQEADRIRSHIVEAEASLLTRPQDTDARTHLADLYFDMGMAQEAASDAAGARRAFLKAIEHYEGAKAAGATSADMLTDLGTMYHNVDRPEDAVASFERAIAVSPNHVNAWMNLGVVRQSALNDVAGAIETWRKCIEVDPNSPVAGRVRSFLTAAGASVPR